MTFFRKTFRPLCLGLLPVALLALSGAQSRALLERRMAFRPARHGAASAENVPPALAFANVALGGFRGALADLLWLRAQRLQEAGRFVEAG